METKYLEPSRAEKPMIMAPRTVSRPAIGHADSMVSLPPVPRRQVEEEADIRKLVLEDSSAEVVNIIKGLDQRSLEGATGNCPCVLIPFGLNPQFYAREKELQLLEDALDPEHKSDSLRVVGISGLGGVGKTQLALHYANAHSESYDVVAWIAADTHIKLTQSLCDLAVKLGLASSVSDDDHYQASLTVRDWLNTSGKRFLLIFDNVDYLHVLMQVWPACGRGSIIITSRSPSVAYKRAQVNMQLLPFSLDAAIHTMNTLVWSEGGGPVDANEIAAAREICRLLGGLPLAIDQISDFIRDRGYSYSEFLPLYKSSSAKIHEKGYASADYDQTLGTVWNISLQKLSPRARTLQNLLAFFDPDNIKERLLRDSHEDEDLEKFGFLANELEFADIVSELIAASLTERSSGTLSVHGLVQAGIFDRLTQSERVSLLDHAVKVLSSSFPNTWNKGGPDQGRDWETWETCNMVLPHVSWLLKLVRTHNLSVNNPELLAELIFRAASYLWQREQLFTAQEFVHFGLSLVFEKATAPFYTAFMLLGHIALDMAQPGMALQAYSEALSARLKKPVPDESELADIYDYIAFSLTELDNVEEAFQYLETDKNIRARNESRLGATTAAVMALAQLKSNNPQAAVESLHKAWELQELSPAGIEESRNPKHSGDIMLMSRIQHALGNRKEALELASRSITIRKNILGGKGPRVADSMYHLASMLRTDNNALLAAKLLRDVLDISQGIREMDGQMARALWTLGLIEQDLGNDEEAAKLMSHAKEVRARINGSDNGSETTNEAFEKLVPYLLW